MYLDDGRSMCPHCKKYPWVIIEPNHDPCPTMPPAQPEGPDDPSPKRYLSITVDGSYDGLSVDPEAFQAILDSHCAMIIDEVMELDYRSHK